MRRIYFIGALVVAAVLASCGGGDRTVPGDYPTIQSGVDAADPGDLVLVQAGVYKEAISVTTPGLTIRGVDRNEVILDGEFTRENGIVATADGVAMENVTARNYTVNGFFWKRSHRLQRLLPDGRRRLGLWDLCVRFG